MWRNGGLFRASAWRRSFLTHRTNARKHAEKSQNVTKSVSPAETHRPSQTTAGTAWEPASATDAASDWRRYCVGERDMIRLNAVLNELSDS